MKTLLQFKASTFSTSSNFIRKRFGVIACKQFVNSISKTMSFMFFLRVTKHSLLVGLNGTKLIAIGKDRLAPCLPLLGEVSKLDIANQKAV